MVLLGVLLILVALVVVAYMLFGTQGLGQIEIDLGVFTALLTPLQIFLTGVASILVLSTGSALLAAGLARKRTRRSEVKALRRQVKQTERREEPRRDTDDTTEREVGSRRGATAESAGVSRGRDDAESRDDRADRGREDRNDHRDRHTGDREGRSGATRAEAGRSRGEEDGSLDGDERPAAERGDDRRTGGIDPTAFRP